MILDEPAVADSYRAAYSGKALTADETRVLDAAVALAGDALEDREVWYADSEKSSLEE